jgi:RNA polymerase sigma factor (sigma-70 family)
MPKFTLIPGGRDAATAFENLIRPHFHALYRRAYRLTLNAADAEDLVQDVCIRAYPRLAEIQELDNPRAWLMRVLYRLFVDLTRQRKSSPIQAMDMGGDEEEFSHCFTSDEPGPEAQADSAIGEQRLERAWQRLDKVQRALLALHDIEGYTLAELQDMTGLPEGTLKSRLHRARIRLGRILKSEALHGALASGREVKS